MLSQPDLSGALFVEQSGTKKRERRAEIATQKNSRISCVQLIF